MGNIENSNGIDFRNRKVSLKKSDFTEKKDLELFDMFIKASGKKGKNISLTQNDIFSEAFGIDGDKNKEISEDEIQAFLETKDAKKKKITAQDITNFLNRVTELSPTEEEELLKKFNSLSIKDSDGNELITDEIRSLVTENSEGIIRMSLSDLYDDEGHIKKGYELFDVDNDGTIKPRDVLYYQEGITYSKQKELGNRNTTVKDFIKNVIRLAEEKQQTDTKLSEVKDVVDESTGQKSVTEKIKELFSSGYSGSKISLNNVTNPDNTVKKGFELFDLNGDGKVDNVEKGVFNGKTEEEFSEIIQQLDKKGSAESVADGKFDKADKQALYNEKFEQTLPQKIKDLNENQLRDNHNQNLVTDEIKQVFSDGKITMDEITDENGQIKDGMQVFDLNGDGKIDNIESGFFERGGNAYVTETETLEIQIDSFINALKSLERVSYGKAGYSGNISENEKKAMYKMLESSKLLLKRIEEFSPELQNRYKQALSEVTLTDTASDGVAGLYFGGKIDMNANKYNTENLASTLFHETTHHILTQFGMDSLSQEVETFYTQYKLHKANKHKPDYNQSENGKSYSLKTDYFDIIDNLKKQYPEMSEIEIATEAFIRSEYFDDYVRQYHSKNKGDPATNLRNEDYFQLDGLITNKKPV